METEAINWLEREREREREMSYRGSRINVAMEGRIIKTTLNGFFLKRR